MEPVLGVVFHPPSQEMFAGLIGIGAVLLNERLAQFRPLGPSSPNPSGRAVIGTHHSVEKPELSFRFLENLLLEATLSRDQIERALVLGSGQLALAYVAARRFQVFANVTTHYWNAFAGVAIVEAAFGEKMVFDIAGNHWNVGSNGIVAWSGPEAKRALGEMVRRALVR